MSLNLGLMLLWVVVGIATGNEFWYALAAISAAFAIACAALEYKG